MHYNSNYGMNRVGSSYGHHVSTDNAKLKN